MTRAAGGPSLLRLDGRDANAWRVARAARAGVLVDADAYFRAVHAALVGAERQVLIVGWDIDSRLCVRRDLDEQGRRAATLGPLLSSLVRRRGGPEVFIPSWDFNLIYALEREPFPQLKLGWLAHKRLHFELDDMHPLGASQHQKIVVVDDELAFCGGLDLCGARWDTPEHKVPDPRRVDPPLRPHPPFHDVQVALTGEVAAALGDLARERGFRATGQHVHPPAGSSSRDQLATRLWLTGTSTSGASAVRTSRRCTSGWAWCRRARARSRRVDRSLRSTGSGVGRRRRCCTCGCTRARSPGWPRITSRSSLRCRSPARFPRLRSFDYCRGPGLG
jgi:phosphatidylserine/phosphatidylglycerophosphate/cardiolipin synthase-like enzyme